MKFLKSVWAAIVAWFDVEPSTARPIDFSQYFEVEQNKTWKYEKTVHPAVDKAMKEFEEIAASRLTPKQIRERDERIELARSSAHAWAAVESTVFAGPAVKSAYVPKPQKKKVAPAQTKPTAVERKVRSDKGTTRLKPEDVRRAAVDRDIAERVARRDDMDLSSAISYPSHSHSSSSHSCDSHSHSSSSSSYDSGSSSSSSSCDSGGGGGGGD